MESSLNYLIFQTVRKKSHLVELNIFKENTFYGTQKILLDNLPLNVYIAIVNGTRVQKFKIGYQAKFLTKNKCSSQTLFPVRAILL